MKTITDSMREHLNSRCTTLAACWRVVRLKDAMTFGFTEHDEDIDYGGVRYYASSAISPSAIQSSMGSRVNNLEIVGALDSDQITEEDLRNKMFDSAWVYLFFINYKDTSQGIIKAKRGSFGSVKFVDGKFIVEFRDMFAVLQQTIVEVTSPTCRAQFCDARCGLNEASNTYTGTITGLTNQVTLVDSGRTEDTNFFTNGRIIMTSGLNSGYGMYKEIVSFNGGTMQLFERFPYDVQVGDTYSAVAGCLYTLEACKGHSNVINFYGEPHKPTPDQVGLIGEQSQ